MVIGAIVHGDEVGSLPAILDLIDALNSGTIQYGGKVTIFLGNPEASLADRRFLEADLNRVFIDDPPDCHEGRRARELKPILDAADVFLDLHQTILHTDRPFYIFPFAAEGWRWARAIGGARSWVTRAPDATFSSGTCCADEYVRARNRPGLTLELGQKGLSTEAADRARYALTRLLALADAVGTNPDALTARADAEPALDLWHTTLRQPFDQPTLRLRPGLTNFAAVRAGDNLAADGTPEILAPQDGRLLFPKYPDYQADGRVVEPRPGEIVRIIQPLEEAEAVGWLGG